MCVLYVNHAWDCTTEIVPVYYFCSGITTGATIAWGGGGCVVGGMIVKINLVCWCAYIIWRPGVLNSYIAVGGFSFESRFHARFEKLDGDPRDRLAVKYKQRSTRHESQTIFAVPGENVKKALFTQFFFFDYFCRVRAYPITVYRVKIIWDPNYDWINGYCVPCTVFIFDICGW